MHTSLETTPFQANVLILDLSFWDSLLCCSYPNFSLIYVYLYRTSSSIRLSWYSWVAKPFLLWSVLSFCNSVSAREGIRKIVFKMKMSLLLPTTIWPHERSLSLCNLSPCPQHFALHCNSGSVKCAFASEGCPLKFVLKLLLSSVSCIFTCWS